jgi:glycosyltransferase involved in cell wall biosynthesis
MLVRCLAMMRGGGETRHLAWARELAALGVEVDIIAGRPLLFGGPRYPSEAGMRVSLLRSPYTRDFVYRHQHQRGFGRLTMTALHADEEWFCRAAWRRITAATVKPDIVHAHALHQAARLRLGDIPVVLNLPGEPHARYHGDLACADALVADGWAADQLPRKIGRSIHRVPKGVDADAFRPDGPSERAALGLEGRRVVITVARLVPIKNVQLLVEAVALVRHRVRDAHLLIVGDGPERERVRARAIALGISDAVTLVGSVPQRETPAYYRAADVFALSSDFDNSPNAVLEAMASGLPVVATDVGGVREFMPDDAGGAVVPHRDPGALANAIERYITRPAEARAAGALNRRRAAADYSWRSSAERLLDVYRLAIDGRGRAERASA